jgi:hypothetical protein
VAAFLLVTLLASGFMRRHIPVGLQIALPGAAHGN